VGRTLLSDAVDVDLGFCGERAGRVQHRGRAALQRRVKGERVEQAFQACMKEAPRRAGFSRRGTSTQRGDSRPFDKLRTGPQLSTGPGSSLRHKVPQGPMKIARQFTGGNAQPQTPTASRRDARPHRTAAETWSRARPTLIPARSIDSHLSKTTKGGAGFFSAQGDGKFKAGPAPSAETMPVPLTQSSYRIGHKAHWTSKWTRVFG
jgi:hypothetical protein